MPSDVPPSIRIVCFDLGGVLVRIHHTWGDACRAAGLAARDEPAGAPVEAKCSALNARLMVGEIAIDEWAEGISRAFDGAYSAEEAVRAHDAITQDEYEGATALIVALHDAGIATACLSNTDHAHWARFVPADGDPSGARALEYPTVARIQSRFASHLLGLAKPDAAIYQAFERTTGLRGHDIVFFDDRPENVDAARLRGWRAHRIDPERDPIAQMREHLRRHGVLGS